jgi:hypothetical protein
MNQGKDTAPDYLYTVHPGAGQCGLQGMKKQGFIAAKGQHVYGCSCRFQWHLTPIEIDELLKTRSLRFE